VDEQSPQGTGIASGRFEACANLGWKDCVSTTVEVRIFKEIAHMPVVADKTLRLPRALLPDADRQDARGAQAHGSGQVLEVTSDDPGSEQT
jgi:hypothetical protein